MREAACFAIAASLCAMAVPAGARGEPDVVRDSYVPTGSLVSQRLKPVTGEDRDRFFDTLASCVVQRAPARADFFLRQSDDFGSSESIGDFIDFLPLASCAGRIASPFAAAVKATVDTRSLRNWLSEKAYLAANREYRAPTGEVGVAERAYFTREALLQAQGLGVFSDCIVKQDAQAADALVRTERGSPEERAAAKALVPAMSRCLTTAQSFKLNQQIIRGLAAQGLWQRYEAPKLSAYRAGK